MDLSSLRISRLPTLLALIALLALVAACGGTKGRAATVPADSTPRPTPRSSTPVDASMFITPTATPDPNNLPPPPQNEGCTLATRQQAAAALGEAVLEGKAVSSGPQQLAPGLNVVASTCRFDSATTGRSLTLIVYRGSGVATARARQIVEQAICARKEALTGVGDLACWYDAHHNEVQFLKGLVFVDITATGITGPTRGPAITTLAKAVAANIR